MSPPTTDPTQGSWLDGLLRFCLDHKLVVVLLMTFVIGWGALVAPFDWDLWGLPRDPVPVDAIPDIGENQQIVFTEWPGRSPQDIEDQITYPLTVALLGLPRVKTVRSFSMFGFSTIYVIFDEGVDFYWSRARILEKLNSLPDGVLPPGLRPALGPDATALGQVFWYTLEGRDPDGNVTGGWDLHELRSIQDWHVRYALLAAEGISEVAGVGGFVQEYQIDVDPDAMRAHGVQLPEILQAVRMSNLDVGAQSIEVNRVEYVIRGVGFVKKLSDIENAVVKVTDNVPIYVRNVAHVALGPAMRRGALDKQGTEAVGGVVVVRYGENPLAAIQNIKRKIESIAPGLPRKTLEDGTVSQVTIVPFYDRTGLIQETLGTLSDALSAQILITIIVVIVMVMHLRSSILIGSLLPLAVLICFIFMRQFNVDANVVALAGIAIAIGAMVDIGIVMCENILRHLDEAHPNENRRDVVLRATSEVGGAIIAAVATTIVSFLPVFTMEAAEGKLFRPLAFTKTFALFAAVIVALTIIPALAHVLFANRVQGRGRYLLGLALVGMGIAAMFFFPWWLGALSMAAGVYALALRHLPAYVRGWSTRLGNWAMVLLVGYWLTVQWMPLGVGEGFFYNALFVALVISSVLGFFYAYLWAYPSVLRWCLDNKLLFLTLPTLIVLLGMMVWLGFQSMFGWLPQSVRLWKPIVQLAHAFPGLGKEFMPPLDEGSYLLMPTTMPHASIGEVLDVLKKQDMAIHAIPEVSGVVGKLGRADSPLDPAPLSMIETVINYHPQYLSDSDGRRLTYRHVSDATDVFRAVDGTPLLAPDGEHYVVRGRFERDEDGALIPDPGGRAFRIWRPPLDPELNPDRTAWDGIRRPDDIWDEITRAATVPGVTGAPRLQPIAARVVMLQSGMRAPMGVKVQGPDLATIDAVGMRLEALLKEVPQIEPTSVTADRIVGTPYLEIHIDREAIARHGIMMNQAQEIIEVAIGGMQVTTTVEGRARYAVRVRYLRELRDSIESLERILIPAPDGAQIPLGQLARIEYTRGPEMIKSEDTFLIGYVLFDRRAGYAEVDVVHAAQDYLREQLRAGTLELPAGVSYHFAGSYENQVRAAKRLSLILPLSLFVIFIILYLQFGSAASAGVVFTGIGVAWSGGFLMIWLYDQSWFLNVSLHGLNLRELFQLQTINLSVAVWVGFLALFGIATDDGVIMTTYLDQSLRRREPENVPDLRRAVHEAGMRRIRPCMMTTATTVLALLPVLTSTGRGSDIMIPMAIPTFGGMTIAVMTVLVVPVLYCMIKESSLRGRARREQTTP